MPEPLDQNWEIVEELVRVLPRLHNKMVKAVTVTRAGYYPLDLHSQATELKRLVEALRLGALAGGLPPFDWEFAMGPESEESGMCWAISVTVSLKPTPDGDVYRS
jgi:hypothetical protein